MDEVGCTLELRCRSRSRCKGADLRGYDASQVERLRKIHDRLSEARRELDALIGDAYLRPRASIVPVHFLDLAAAVEKLRWAEKEWRELDQELDTDVSNETQASGDSSEGETADEELDPDDAEPAAVLEPAR